MRKLNTCLHVMYLLMVGSGIVFIAMGNFVTGWSFWLVGFGMWIVLMALELMIVDNKNKNAGN